MSWTESRILQQSRVRLFFYGWPVHDAAYWIDKLDMVEHPEGGCFAPVFRSREKLGKEYLPDRFPGDRSTVSSIYYLLKKDRFSAFHRLKSVEIWNFFEGGPLTIHVLDPLGVLTEKRLGPNFEDGESFQVVIEAGNWFAAEQKGPGEFTLVGCTVAPGFEYEDMEIGGKAELLAEYPQHQEIIERFTRPSR